jgi:hypothetical protein
MVSMLFSRISSESADRPFAQARRKLFHGLDEAGRARRAQGAHLTMADKSEH